MIKKIHTEYFKGFKKQDFELGPISLLAGPNNSGKSTLLQAVMVWNLAMQKWCEKKGPGSGSKATDRQGAPITRPEFSALPLPSMDQLWKDTHTSLRKDEVEGKPAGSPRPMVISLTGETQTGTHWQFGFEFRYSGPEQIHVKPVVSDLENLELARQQVSVIYIPPFSGIGVNETRHDRPFQDMLVGQGKGGDILRNLLLEVAEKSDKEWNELEEIVARIFHYKLLRPKYHGAPYITCQYLKGIPEGRGNGGLAPLDVSTAGSGFHQVLLILAFLFARPSSLILLDEPDAHLHVILQKELYDLLRSLCNARRSQLLIATHSEVLIESTSPHSILSFYREPHKLSENTERDSLREALKRVTTFDLLAAEDAKGVLYVEDVTDFELLKAWAMVLEHPLCDWFEGTPFWQNNRGRSPKEARAHFFAMRSVADNLKGLLLLDGDNRQLPDHEVEGDNLTILRWKRYEVESYLLHPDALQRFLEREVGGLMSIQGMDYLRQQMPPAFFENPLAISPVLQAEPASKKLLPEVLQRAGASTRKSEYFLIAKQMLPSELPDEISQKLGQIHKRLS